MRASRVRSFQRGTFWLEIGTFEQDLFPPQKAKFSPLAYSFLQSTIQVIVEVRHVGCEALS